MTSSPSRGTAAVGSWGRAELACLAVVLVTRLALFAGAGNDPVFRIPYLDGAFYDTWARSLFERHVDFTGPYFLGPIYPYFLAGLYALAGPDPIVARIAQSALGVIDAVLVLAITRRIFGTGPACFAVVLFALYGPLVFYENLLVMETLVLSLALAALAVALLPRGHVRVRAALCGMLLGLASLGRPSVLVALPVMLLALRESGRGLGISPDPRATSPRRPGGTPSVGRSMGALGMAVAVALGCLLVLLPVLIRNASQGGGLVITTNGGVNFYAGNNPEANGRFREPPGVRFFRDPAFVSASQASLPPAVAARALSVRAVAGTEAAADSRRWAARSFEWIRARPFDAAALVLRRMWLVLQAHEIPQIESYEFHARRLPVLRAFVVDFGWLWPLALLGVWRARRDRRRGWRSLAAFGTAMLFPCVVFFVTARYRLACVPVVASFAGFGAWWMIERVRHREWRQAIVAALVLAPVGVGARLGARPARGAAGWESAQMAERLYAAGDLDAAIGFQEAAARDLSNRWEPALNLALYWSERDRGADLANAVALLRELARGWPREPIVQFNYGVVLEQQGDLEGARSAWRAALVADPGFEPARSRLLQTSPGAPR